MYIEKKTMKFINFDTGFHYFIFLLLIYPLLLKKKLRYFYFLLFKKKFIIKDNQIIYFKTKKNVYSLSNIQIIAYTAIKTIKIYDLKMEEVIADSQL